MSSVRSYLGPYFNLVAIDKDYAILARAGRQEGDALRTSCTRVEGHAACRQRQQEEEKKSGANQNEASTRQVASIGPPAVGLAGTYWLLAR